jgi:uncharacterized protein with PQ loop repeat
MEPPRAADDWMVDRVTLIGTLAGALGFVTALSPLLQVRAIVRSRSAAGVSLAQLVLVGASASAWVAYGLAQPALPLVVSNSVTVVTSALAVTVAWRHRRHVPAAPVAVRRRASVPAPVSEQMGSTAAQ